MTGERGDAVRTCKHTSSPARYSAWSFSATPAHSLLSMLQVALHPHMYFTLGLSFVHRLLYQLNQIFTMLQAWSASITLRNRAASTSNFSAASGSTASSRRIGPKSDGVHSKPGAKFMMLMTMISLNMQPSKSVFVDARVEGWCFFHTAPEVAGRGPAAKHSGLRRASEPHSQIHLTRSGKRSYQRAYGRACRMGGTPYKGRRRPWTWFEPRQLQPQFCRSSTSCKATSSRLLAYLHVERRRAYDQHLSGAGDACQRKCAMMLSACRKPNGGMTITWTNEDFHYIHSQGLGKEDRVAGLLIKFSTRLVKEDDIQYVAVHPGRLLHVRIPRGQSSVDIVNWYQYSVSDAEGVFERRLALLTKLQKCVAGLPQRNSLLWPETSTALFRRTHLSVATVC